MVRRRGSVPLAVAGRGRPMSARRRRAARPTRGVAYPRMGDAGAPARSYRPKMIPRLRVLAPLLALLLPLVAVAAPPASSAPSRTSYDVLGDSYGSGYGVPPYGACGRSQSAYGVLV